MSVIIGYINNGAVYFATDTQRTIGNFRYSVTTDTGANVFRMPNGVICGAVRSQSIKQIIMAHPEWFEGLTERPLTKQYIIENIIPCLYSHMNDSNLIDKDSIKDGRSRFDGAIFLAQKDKLFCIDGDFSVLTIPKFCIIGSSPEYSYPRVSSYKNDVPLKEMLYYSMLDAQKFCNTVSGPYYLYSTNSKEKELLGGKN